MWLTKNEKQVLKLLIEDANLSDSYIANQLNISSQAIGKIRKRLEKEIIKGYTVNLDSKKLGVNVIVMFKVTINRSDEKLNQEKLEHRLKELPEVFMILKTLSGVHDYILLTAFSNMDELEKFITQNNKHGTFDSYCTIKELISLPHSCILKKSEKQLLNKMIDNCGTKNIDVSWPE